MKLNIKNTLALIRPQQYIKNLFILMPLFFVGHITDLRLVLDTAIAFVAFSLSASAIYILNDYRDIEEDRLHPQKKNRPLASGSISKKGALLLMSIFFVVSSSLMAILSFQALAILSTYILFNIAYSFYLKQIAILDVTIVAIGFVLRLFVGSSVTEIPLSKWIIIMTFLLALFMALAKRRDDVVIFLNTGKKIRKVQGGYNLQLIDGAMIIMAAVIIVVYILYTTSAEILQRLQFEHLYLTALFVVLGIMRYLQIVLVENNSSSPSMILLKDKFIQVTIIAWILSFVWIIY